MPRIQALEPHVAELIAAGEVVERPASVVKELVENSMDAGASVINIEIRRGGIGMIRVSDNGCGIAPEDLPTAFLRHATSKLRNPEDLADIHTLGFRGEALAAICAVSRVEIITREKGALSGALLRVEGGTHGDTEEAGTPEGTVITVRDLFYNTPARLKFMRKENAEAAAIGDLIRHLALSHPAIAFEFRKDDMPVSRTPGDGQFISAIYAALGRDFAATLIPADGRGGESGKEIVIEGFVTAPVHGRGSRSMQVFFVNGRYIKSQLLTAALEEAYRNQLLKGKFPGCVLSVNLPADQVDVNVHPAKTQIKFAREREVFDIVYHTVLDTLMAHGGPIPAPGYRADSGNHGNYGNHGDNYANYSNYDNHNRELTAPSRGDFFQNMDAKTYRTRMTGKTDGGYYYQGGANGKTGGYNSDNKTGKADGYNTAVIIGDRKARLKWTGENEDIKPPVLIPDSNPADAVSVPEDNNGRDTPPMPEDRDAPPAPPVWENDLPDMPPAPDKYDEYHETAQPVRDKKPEAIMTVQEDNLRLNGQERMKDVMPVQENPAWRMIGEAFRTYMICESGDDIWLIDKHAAHERINFDKLQNAREPPMRQTLLTPFAWEAGREDAALLLENLEILERLGFACEDFGDGSILIREVPAGVDPEDIQAALEELADNFRTGRSIEERRDAALRTVACKMSIKGGWENSEQELYVLMEKVRSGEIRFCPHGRPVAVKLSKRELEKKFKRT